MIVVLLGYMGSGKSTIGSYLANILNYDFIDLDTFIELQEKSKIAEIFRTKGEIYFRKKEAQYLRDILDNSNNLVLALGGGTPCYAINMNQILNRQNVKSFYLRLSVSQLTDRLLNEKDKRPLISHIKTKDDLQEFIGKHLFERANYYNKSHVIIDVQNSSVKDTTEAILLHLI
ncbi:shikimate kinase [Winogradskyella alexanderae]|uniref:Shikimate kinase n=1 Tax=Winogradskyella alexanderae TaxID=2877123 RepID=A0ABS7XQT1_9FLAO|nr:shikimate kinase [Winogradskyella alexanderae]MCA0132361.1 AAA family ATPase [Winogradskyella alexanderae]